MEPVDGETVRWDAGFETGDRVPSNYDSMIAKLIVHEGNRRMQPASGSSRPCRTCSWRGVPSNAGFLAAARRRMPSSIIPIM
jgi:3-methylcrotonyl-CoA carboxylase alpha subunit